MVIETAIFSDFGEIRRVQQLIEDAMHSAGYGEYDIFKIKVALEEVLVNAVKHGNQMIYEKQVQIRCAVEPDQFDIRISDEGTGFDPKDVPDPTGYLEIEKPCGRGLHIIKHFMTKIEYVGNGNTVVMSKAITREQAE